MVIQKCLTYQADLNGALKSIHYQAPAKSISQAWPPDHGFVHNY